MKIKTFVIPAKYPQAGEEDLNRFLAGRRLLGMDRQFVADGDSSYWAFLIEYADGDRCEPAESKALKVDYKQVLSPGAFRIFSALRTLRRQTAEQEGVPVYAIFTNEQLARMAESPPQSAAALKAIPGVGESRASRYGKSVMDLLQELAESAATENPETEGT